MQISLLRKLEKTGILGCKPLTFYSFRLSHFDTNTERIKDEEEEQVKTNKSKQIKLEINALSKDNIVTNDHKLGTTEIKKKVIRNGESSFNNMVIINVNNCRLINYIQFIAN